MYGSKRVFEAFGLWTRLARIAEPIHAVSLEDRGTGAGIAYQAAEIADHPFGYGLETSALRRLLLELALERTGIQIVAPARLVGFRRSGNGIAAELDDGRRLDAALIVGADGRGSTVRARAGLDGSVRAYPQVALTFAIRHERPHDGRVREFLLPAGPLALLPIGSEPLLGDLGRETGPGTSPAGGARAVLAAMLDERLGDVLGAFEIAGEPTGHAAEPPSGQAVRRAPDRARRRCGARHPSDPCPGLQPRRARRRDARRAAGRGGRRRPRSRGSPKFSCATIACGAPTPAWSPP